jgi:hypothetical protein
MSAIWVEGRINALAKVHTPFVESRWTGAQLHLRLPYPAAAPMGGAAADEVLLGM